MYFWSFNKTGRLSKLPKSKTGRLFLNRNETKLYFETAESRRQRKVYLSFLSYYRFLCSCLYIQPWSELLPTLALRMSYRWELLAECRLDFDFFSPFFSPFFLCVIVIVTKYSFENCICHCMATWMPYERAYCDIQWEIHLAESK